jgi:hypothetical protein
MSEKYNRISEIEWTPKNILMVAAASVFMLSGIWYGNYRSVKMLEEKKAKFHAMTLKELGEYIIEKNSGVVKIDMITKVKGVYMKDNKLIFPYHVTDGFLSKLSTKIKGGEDSMKQYLQEDTIEEDCSKTAFRIFLDKGGIMYYEYYLVRDEIKTFLFSFENTFSMCKDIAAS